MGINLGGGFTSNNDVTTENNNSSAISLNLVKNEVLDLTKRNPGLTHVKLGAGWDVSNGNGDFDLDIVALLIDSDGSLKSASNVIFFNNKSAKGIALSGDNRTGAGTGDDETITINLSEIDSNIDKIVFAISIFGAREKRQTFGMINNSYVRLLDVANGEKELCKFNLKENSSTATTVIFAELKRDLAEWQFKAIGEGKMADLNELVAMY